MIYDKKTLTIEEHIQQLRDRGLIIEDEPLAKHYLGNVSYYRLAGYWWPMQKDKVNHTF
jgi:abortive infection bacteriophage resistance protein